MSQLGILPIASLVLENPPLQASNALYYLIVFAQDGGGFALLGLWIWLLLRIMRAATPQFREAGGFRLPLAVLAVATASLILFALGAIWELNAAIQAREAMKAGNVLDAPTYSKWGNRLMTMGGVLALLGVFVPFIRDGLGLSFRRIWALSRLSFTEAVRRRILWVFLVFLLLFLFPPKWWNPTIKPEDEIRDNISVIYTASTPLLLFAATLLTAFSIPTDIRNQTIHTVVTKPVQKFEIVIGRFLGYLFLTTLVLIAVFSFGLLMVYVSRVEPEAREESMKARVPLYGELRFSGPNNFRGESVGREWDYRKYMQGGPNSPYRANWFYGDRELDRSLAEQDHVRCEFSFDIFRTTKGEEGKGVFCTFYVVAWQSAPNVNEVARQYHERIKGLSPSARPRDDGATDTEAADWATLDRIAGELGYYEFRSKEIADYHTDFISIPTGIVKKALEGTPTKLDPAGQGALAQPRMFVQVRLDSRTQFLGVAKPDLYLLAREEPFWLNFYKGAAGLWLRLCVVIGIAVTFSTYLNGVVTFLATLFFVVLGFGRWFIISMAMVPIGQPGQFNPGPTDSLRKLITGESLGMSSDTASATQQVTQGADEVFRWCLRRLLNLLPNMERLSWSDYVANGFNIPLDDLGLNLIFVLAYLSLWAAAAHFLMKEREIATW